MIDRRGFLASSAAAAAALAVSPVLGCATARTSAASVLALVDRALDGSGAFAAEALARGQSVLEFSSDAAGVWMRELEPRLRLGPAAIAGRTSAATLFCLDLLARDYGARTVQRIDTATAVIWTISSNPQRRAALAPPPIRSEGHA